MNRKLHVRLVVALTILAASMVNACVTPRGTGDLGVVVERAQGRLQIIDTTAHTRLASVTGLGDLSHASVVYSRDQRYAYVFGRDGGLSKVDMLRQRIDKRVIQAGNSIGGAISQDGRLLAVSNYEPGGVKIFAASDLRQLADIPAVYGSEQRRSKVVGLVDAPGQRFVFSLYDAAEIWIVDMTQTTEPQIRKFTSVGRQPYDALITPDGRYYIAGLYGEDGMALLDLWQPDKGAKRILHHYGRGQKKMPVYKMPHLEGWAMAGEFLFVPAIGRKRVLVIDHNSWRQVGSIEVHGQPVFVMARPDGRQIWVNFAYPDNSAVQVIDVQARQVIKTLEPGKAVLHMEFTPRGEQVWISVRDADRIDIFDTASLARLGSLPADKPSGIFFSARAHKIGL